MGGTSQQLGADELLETPDLPALETIAHTLVYDAMVIRDLGFPTELVASLPTPTLVINGSSARRSCTAQRRRSSARSRTDAASSCRERAMTSRRRRSRRR